MIDKDRELIRSRLLQAREELEADFTNGQGVINPEDIRNRIDDLNLIAQEVVSCMLMLLEKVNND